MSEQRTPHGTSLEARVRAFNRAGRLANELFPRLVAHFQPFLGKKVALKESGLSKQAKEGMPDLPEVPEFQFRSLMVVADGSSLHFRVKVLEADQRGRTFYGEVHVDLGRLDRKTGKLLDLLPGVPAREDYSAEEVAATRQAVRAAEQALSALKSGLYPFGEFDN